MNVLFLKTQISRSFGGRKEAAVTSTHQTRLDQTRPDLTRSDQRERPSKLVKTTNYQNTARRRRENPGDGKKIDCTVKKNALKIKYL